MEITYAQRAQWYDIECSPLDDALFLQSFITEGVTSVLEIPCGTGRNIPWLMRTGRSIILADICPQMVEICRQKAEVSDCVQVIEGDMQMLSLSFSVDFILVPQDAFLMLPSKQSMLQALFSLRACLAPQGQILIDLPTLGMRGGDISLLPRYYDPCLSDGECVNEWTRDIPNERKLRRFRTQTHTSNNVRFFFQYEILNSKDRVLEKYSTEFALLRVSIEQMKQLFFQAGFEIVVIYGNYKKKLFDEHARRAIFLCKLRKE